MIQEPTSQIEALEDETDEMADVLAALVDRDAITEQRHQQLLGEIQECRNRLEVLSLTKVEDPNQAGFREELIRVNLQMVEVLSSLQDLKTQASQTLSELARVPEAPPIPSSEPEPERSTDEPALVAPATPEAPPIPAKRKHRVI